VTRSLSVSEAGNSFLVQIRVSKWQNQYLPDNQRGEDLEVEALVDSSAVELCLPVEMVEKLRLLQVGTITGETKDGLRQPLRVMGVAVVEVAGRTAAGQIIELPRGSQARLGSVPLQEMDWHISAQEQRLVPNSRSPDEPLLHL
jgi:hypothetical protein